MMSDFQIVDKGDHREVIIDGNSHTTKYSKHLIELISKRKGQKRAIEYISYKEKRAFYLDPLFRYISENRLNNLRVLEVGCSAGHMTELLSEQPQIDQIVACDADRAMVEISRLKCREFDLKKVKSIDLVVPGQHQLDYPDNYFDIIILLAVAEHLPMENRHMYVDQYYKKLKCSGIIMFLETPNRHYFYETHSIGLPFIQKMNPQTAFVYARLFKKLDPSVTFSEFMRAGTGWRNSSYDECLPKEPMIQVTDVSEEVGYGFPFFMERVRKKGGKGKLYRLIRWLSQLIGFPTDFYLPVLNIVFRKEADLSQPDA